MSRRQGRYERRKEKREEKKRSKGNQTIEEVFSFHTTYKYGKISCNGVRWKTSVQNFERHLLSGTAARRRKILNGTYKWKRYTHFKLSERGKLRDIDAPHITDRQMQKVLTKEVLLPIYEPRMIYNNGASLKGKGLIFSQGLLKRDLLRHYGRYGLNGSIIIADCKGFFPNADHEKIKQTHAELIHDEKMRGLLDSIIDTVPSNKGVPLGVEPSQIEMVGYPAKVDAFIGCQLGISGYGHYMDDYYILVPPDKDPHEILKQFISKAEEHGMKISTEKTRIVKFGKPFRYCKVKYELSENGKIKSHGCRKSAYRAIRKIKLFKEKIDNSEMQYMDLWQPVQNTLNYFSKHNDHGRLLHIRRVFYAIYGFDCTKVENYKEKDKMTYITHTRYDGVNLKGEPVLIRRKKRLERDGDILFFEDEPICIYRSQVAKEHFAINSDCKGLERGDLIRKIAFSEKRYTVDEGGHPHSQRFNEKQIDILCSNKWAKYINPNTDMLIFADCFFEADIYELQQLLNELEECDV